MSDGPRFQYKPRRERLSLDDPGILDLITSIASYRHTQAEAAALLQVSKSCFEAFLRDNPEAKDAWKDGRQYCKASIRRLLFLHAKSDPSTARYLAKHALEDFSETTPADAAAEAVGKAVLSVAEARQRILELNAKLAPPAEPRHTGKAVARR